MKRTPVKTLSKSTSKEGTVATSSAPDFVEVHRDVNDAVMKTAYAMASLGAWIYDEPSNLEESNTVLDLLNQAYPLLCRAGKITTDSVNKPST